MLKPLLCSLFLSALSLQGAIEYECVELTPINRNEKIETILDFNDQGLALGCGFRDEMYSFDFVWDQIIGMRDLNTVVDGLQDVVSLNNLNSFTGIVEVNEKAQAFLQTPEEFTLLDLPHLTKLRPSVMNNHNEIILYGQNAAEQWECYLWQPSLGFEKMNFWDVKDEGFVVCFNDNRQMLYLSLEKGNFSLIEKGKNRLFSESRYVLLGIKLNQLGDVVGVRISKRTEQISGMIWCANGKNIEVKREGADIALLDINDQKQAVGEMSLLDQEDETSANHAIFWEDGRGLLFLNDLIDPQSGYVLKSALKINSKGQIIAEGINANYENVIFLLNPINKL